MEKIGAVAKQKIKENLKCAIKENGMVALTTDLWNDDYKRVSYLSLTAHYMKESTDGLKLRNETTSLIPLDAGVSKSFDYLRLKLENEMESLGITNPIETVRFVTDRGKFEFKIICHNLLTKTIFYIFFFEKDRIF